MGLVALTENLILLQFEFRIDYDVEAGGKVLLKRNDDESCCLLTKRRPDTYVHLTVDMEDYHRIKDAETDKKNDSKH